MVVDRPEIELLLSCARIRKDSESVSQITSRLQGDMDWAYLLRTARRHGMMPLLYWPLSTTCPEAVLQAILNQLRNQLHRNAHRDLVLTAELLKLLVLCEAQGIPAISYKGPTLAALAYGNLSLENLLLVRCAHGSKHLWERLGWICDVAELIHARKEMDWERVTEQAAALGGERRFFLGLYLASDLLGAPLPREVLHKAEVDPTVKVLAREAHERLSWGLIVHHLWPLAKYPSTSG